MIGTKPSKKKKKDYASAATKLLEKRRELYDAHDYFEQEKTKFKEEEDSNKIREQALREKDAVIQENIVKFFMSLQEKENERKKAVERCKQQEESNRENQKNLAKLQEQYKIQEINSKMIKKRVQALNRYDEYLGKVMTENQSAYDNITALLQRYENLEKTKHSLEEYRSKTDKESETLKAEMARNERALNQKRLELNNQVSNLKTKLENLDKKKAEDENALQGNEKTLFEENIIVGRIFMAIDSLFYRSIEIDSIYAKGGKRAAIPDLFEEEDDKKVYRKKNAGAEKVDKKKKMEETLFNGRIMFIVS